MTFRKTIFSLLVMVMPGLIFHGFSQVKQHLLQGKHNKMQDSLVVRADTSVPVIITKIENYSYVIDHTNFLFRNPLNISPIYLELNQTEKRLEGFKTRLEEKGKRMNLRSINSAIILLREIAGKLAFYKRTLTNYSTQLSQSNVKVKKIIGDPTLKMQLPDSTLSEQLQDLLTEGNNLDSVQGQILGRVNLLQNHVSIALLQANDIISDMGYLSTEKKLSMWQVEEAPLFEAHPSHYNQTLKGVLQASLQRSAKIVDTYLSGKWKVLSWSFLVFVFLLAWTITNYYRLKKSDDASVSLLPVHFLSRSLVVSNVFGFLTYSPFFFANPPMSYLHAVECLRNVLLVFLLLPLLTKRARMPALVIAVLWILLASDDILLESAFGERWILFIAALSLIATCIQLLRNNKPLFVFIAESPVTKPVLAIALTFAVLSGFFNVTGRLSLAKIAGITAIQSVVLALTLKVFFSIVIEAIYCQFKVISHRRLSVMFDFDQLQARCRVITWTLAIMVWIVSVVRNLTLYDEMIKLLDNFINARRAIGSMVFTFTSIAVFVLIIWISFAFSRVINFFFGTEAMAQNKKKGKIGSLMLLIRLAIWIIGFLIGVSAAGIPMDKLSLMIGAFGVGIGFGLQNIVNNLVSGVILAFERPIQIGDSIEVGNKSGIVREIGVRSSKIENAEGAAIIIPNGDMLSQQLVNWTMHDSSRRLDFILTLPFTSDIEKIKSLIFTELKKDEGILQDPGPAVNVQEFQPNAIQMKVMWWIPDLTKAGAARSIVMQNIYEALNTAGIAFEK